VSLGLDHVQIAAPPGGEAAARAFYGELLRLPEIPKPPSLGARGGVWFVFGDGRQLHVGIEEDFTPARKAHPALALPGDAALDDLAERLAAAGHEPRWDEQLPGVRRFYVSDPFGNRVELLHGG
jgi:catechol 2,3-dioxygenase-like lactoylglutathione lyase family enzyme